MVEKAFKLAASHRQLIQATQAWARGERGALGRARALREQAILENHAHYLERLPVYRRFADQEAIGALQEIEPIKQHLMLPDEIFKSYDQRWLDEHDYGRMNAWLEEIFHQPVEVDVKGIQSLDDWIERLGEHGIRLVCSSGTSGNLSFVPRDASNWNTFVTASACILGPLLMRRKAGTWMQQILVLGAARLLSPESFAGLSRKVGVRDFDAAFLDFQSGRTGNQTLEQQLAPLFRKHVYLYETTLSPSTIRILGRGPKNEREQEQLLRLQEVVVHQKMDNYKRVIEQMRQSTADGQKVFIFGTTQQYLELCQAIGELKTPVHLKPGSLVFYGGGWKLFSGEKIGREKLVGMMAESLGLPAARIVEGYSMTEINAFMLRCEYGRFHIPPSLEAVIYDEELNPMTGSELRGVIGFLDPFATAYPGFMISGDEVRYVEGECECGLEGAAVTEIGRARGREIKGCGGIMAALKA
jgi:hypothetical protein